MSAQGYELGVCRRTPRGIYVLVVLYAFTFMRVSLLEIPQCVGWCVGDCGWFWGGRGPDLCVRCSTVPAFALRHWLEKEKGEKEKDVPSGGRPGPQRPVLFFWATERSEGGSCRFENLTG